MTSILDLLDEEDENDMPAWTNIPDAIKITQGAMEKAFLIYELVEKKFGEPRESYGGPLIDFNDSEAIIRDIVLPKKQLVRKHFITLKPEGVHDLGQEAIKLSEQKDRRLVNAGWWHTHAKDVGQLTASSIDNTNSRLVLNDVSRNTLFYYQDLWDKFFDENASIQDGEDALTLLIKGSAVDPKVRMKLPKTTSSENIELLKRILASANFDVLRTFEVGFSYTLITSARDITPYGEIHIYMKNPFNDLSRHIADQAEVQIVSVEDDIVVNKDELEAIINQRIEEEKIAEAKPRRTRRTFAGSFWKCFSNYGTNLYFSNIDEIPYLETDDSSKIEVVEEKADEKTDEKSSIDACLKRNCARFILACYDYVLHHEDEQCKYSSYVRKTILNLNNEDVGTFYDLINLTGPLSEVKEKQSGIPLNRTEFYLSTLVDISDPKTLGLQLKLMEDFVQARTLEERNTILEKYIPLILHVGEAK